MLDSDCLFCKIAKGEIPCSKVFENESIVAFLDIFPVNPGHTIIIPKKHYQTLLDFPKRDIASFFTQIQNIARFLKEKLKFDGFNIIQNNFSAAGQVVPHFHFHIIPRYKGDNAILIRSTKDKATPVELEDIIKKLH